MEKSDPRLLSAFVDGMYKALADFYEGAGITREYVVEQATKILNGEKPQGGPALFIQGWLKDAGVLPQGDTTHG